MSRTTMLEHLGRLQRRAGVLRERIAARGGPNSSTSYDDAELSSLSVAMGELDAARWRKAIDEPIPGSVATIVAALAEGHEAVIQRDGDRWTCTCGCGRTVDAERIVRWRPVTAVHEPSEQTDEAAGDAAAGDAADGALISPNSSRGRQHLAVIDDRIRYLEARRDELKADGKVARYESAELRALRWLRVRGTRG